MAKPLAECGPGTRGTVVAFSGGGAMQDRVIHMGLHPGCEVEVIHPCSETGGPALLAIGETRLAIGRGMLETIMVATDPK
ncbi:MAG: FeoA family protein [Planctomycetota bacterium]|jgi:ferrous iron transport protein A